jgi:hypothetical protein
MEALLLRRISGAFSSMHEERALVTMGAPILVERDPREFGTTMKEEAMTAIRETSCRLTVE